MLSLLRHGLQLKVQKHSRILTKISELNPSILFCSSKSHISTMTSKEFKIPVPWGHIAGQDWGEAGNEPWIALHGWLDNSGSFETLAPFFTESGRRLLAIDLPGHGFSSYYPPGLQYHYLDGIQYIRRVAEHFKLPKINLISHSMGGGMSMIFTATYPEVVSKLVMLDCIKPISRPIGSVVKRTRQAVDDIFNFERKLESGRAFSYKLEDSVGRLLEATNQLHGEGAVTRESAIVLLKRGTQPVNPEDPNSEVVFTRDLRQRIGSLYGYDTDVIKEFASHIKCPHLIVKGKGGSLYENESEANAVLDVYRTSNQENFVYTVVEGSHHVHLNEPQNVWAAIKPFLEKYST